MVETGYNRAAALAYAEKWAFGRNPSFMNFDGMGGDCTNFVSQCLYAGCRMMNYAYPLGWFYTDPNHRAPAWSGVTYLYNFLTRNQRIGPYAQEVAREEILPGDLLQLGHENGLFYHSPLVVAIRDGELYVAAHSYDAFMRPLSTYAYARVRYLHIAGARQ